MFNYCFAILFVAVGVSAINCPQNMGCTCNSNMLENLFEISCEVNESSINILIKRQLRGNSMKVECSNLKWSDFHLYNLTKYAIKFVSFHKCDLPKNASLKTITDMLGATGVKELHFNLHTNLTYLRRLHLKGFKNLNLLDLSYNIIYTVDNHLLDDLSNLSVLDLRRTNLQKISTVFFNYMPKLRTLNLAKNTLESIESGTLDRLHNLKYFSISENNIIELQSGIFDKLINLRTIDLSANNLVSLPEDIFGKLKNLEELNLASNNFTFLPDNLLKNNTKLQVIDLAFNKKQLDTLPNGFFSNLTKLDLLMLEDNGFIFLPEDLLWGCFSLTTLYLNENYLQFLYKLIFRDLKELTELRLNSNALEELPDYVFANLTQLRTLDLSKNHISFITNEVFHGLNRLEELNMAENFLSVIAAVGFASLHNLRIANFSNNYLTLPESETEYGIRSPFVFCYSLEELYLSNNHIEKIFSDWITDLHYLRKLDLKNNYIPSLSTDDLLFVSKNIEVDLTYNKIQYIFFKNENLLVFHGWFSPHKIVVLIDNNPLHCGCELYNYLRYIKGATHPDINNYLDIVPGNLTCSSPRKFKNVRVTDLQFDNEAFKCTATNTDTALMCPVKCNCFEKQKEKAFIIDCFRKNFTIVPSLTEKPHDFWQVKLNLSNNQLTQLPNLTKLGYGSVSQLILSHNNISEISLEGLSKATKVLELHNNNISKISTDVLNFLKNATNLTFLSLHRNPWICDCSTTNFLDFIHIKHKIIADLQNVTCYGKDTLISNMTVTDFCPNNNEESYERYISMIMFVFVGFIVSISGLFCYKYPHSVTYIQSQLTAFKEKLFARRSIINEDEPDEEKLFDVFVSYSQDDYDFVINELVRELENGSTPLKLCLPYRNWLANEWTTENIVKSMELSRRVMVVLSPSFLENVWAKTELRLAHCQALDRDQSDVILILYGDIDSTNEHLDSELKTYINSNTYIKWGDPAFWKKLKQSLKHNVQLSANHNESVFQYYNQASNELVFS